jgi:hypothetical protein
MDAGTQEQTGNGDGAEAQEPARGTTTRDPELVAINRIFKTLEDLNVTSRSRVVRYVTERYAGLLEDE